MQKDINVKLNWECKTARTSCNKQPRAVGFNLQYYYCLIIRKTCNYFTFRLTHSIYKWRVNITISISDLFLIFSAFSFLYAGWTSCLRRETTS